MDRYTRYTDELSKLKDKGNFRQLPDEPVQLFDLCSNDYLGINQDEKIYSDFIDYTRKSKLNFSSSSSRLLSINSGIHKEFEQIIARAYNKESAILFNSGYHANTGLLSSLPGKNDLIMADKFIHASIIDGAKLSQADFIRYRHLDYNHLENLLKAKRKNYNQVFLVSESIFSMDGDIADIQKLVEIKNRYNCFLSIDEAHALGVRGNSGLGCVEEQHVIDDIDIIIGPLGKAMASIGAFVACNSILREYLINYARPLIYSTCLPPLNVAWSMYIFGLMPDLKVRRLNLSDLSEKFAKMLGQKHESHIIPYMVGENEDAILLSEMLKNSGHNALPVRYPTVPKGSARLRFSLGAHMKIDELKPVIETIQQYESTLD